MSRRLRPLFALAFALGLSASTACGVANGEETCNRMCDCLGSYAPSNCEEDCLGYVNAECVSCVEAAATCSQVDDCTGSAACNP